MENLKKKRHVASESPCFFHQKTAFRRLAGMPFFTDYLNLRNVFSFQIKNPIKYYGEKSKNISRAGLWMTDKPGFLVIQPSLYVREGNLSIKTVLADFVSPSVIADKFHVKSIALCLLWVREMVLFSPSGILNRKKERCHTSL